MAKSSTKADELNIKALLSVALDQKPQTDISERVMDRVALMTTVMEFARLFTAAPFAWLSDGASDDTDPSNGETDETGETDENNENDDDADDDAHDHTS